MDFCFATFAALFMLLAAASGASLRDPCAGVRSSSLELNHIARIVSVEARSGSKDVSEFDTSLVWMEAKDRCDPGSLKRNSTACIEKMLDVLTSYSSAVERVSGFRSCSEFVRRVKPAVDKLQKDMNLCVKSISKHGGKSHIRKEERRPIQHSEEALLCHYTMDRLFSFSILTARVFALGDPALHAENPAQQCM